MEWENPLFSFVTEKNDSYPANMQVIACENTGYNHSLNQKEESVLSNKSLKTIAKPVIEPIVTELGYELVDIEYKNPGGPWKLIIYIYKEDGITFEDCELVSKTLDPILDENPDITDRYDFLQVSSSGLDREFKYLKDYLRYIGEKIEISLYAPKDGKKKLIGVLKQADEDTIVIEDKDSSIELKMKDIAKATLAIEF